MVSFPKKISKDSINELPLQAYDGPVTVVDDNEMVPQIIQKLRKCKCLGFDTESRPAFKKGQNFPAALLQLSTEDHVYLFQLLKLENLEPIWELLADGRYLKVGVAIQDDIKKLQERLDFVPGGFVEISDITSAVGILNTGLRSLAAMFLQYRISKGAQVSNWAKSNLTEVQIQYAATDAWVSRELFICLTKDNTFAPFLPQKTPKSGRKAKTVVKNP